MFEKAWLRWSCQQWISRLSIQPVDISWVRAYDTTVIVMASVCYFTIHRHTFQSPNEKSNGNGDAADDDDTLVCWWSLCILVFSSRAHFLSIRHLSVNRINQRPRFPFADNLFCDQRRIQHSLVSPIQCRFRQHVASKKQRKKWCAGGCFDFVDDTVDNDVDGGVNNKANEDDDAVIVMR